MKFLLHDDHDSVGHGHTHEHEHEHEHVHEHTHTHSHDGTTHDHSHMHVHEHNENAEHDHPHDENDLHTAEKEMKTLYALLDHWVEHNHSHQHGFGEWVTKAQTCGKQETADAINRAIEYMSKANEMLKLAKEKME